MKKQDLRQPGPLRKPDPQASETASLPSSSLSPQPAPLPSGAAALGRVPRLGPLLHDGVWVLAEGWRTLQSFSSHPFLCKQGVKARLSPGSQFLQHQLHKAVSPCSTCLLGDTEEITGRRPEAPPLVSVASVCLHSISITQPPQGAQDCFWGRGPRHTTDSSP